MPVSKNNRLYYTKEQYARAKQNTNGYAGQQYGHVGIYVGNGLVYHNIGGVAIDTLSDWISYYDGFAWGWEGGADLTTFD